VIDDAIYFVMAFFVVGISIVMAYIVMGGINDAIQDADQFPNLSQTTMQSQTDSFSTVWDYTTLIIFFAIVAMVIIIAIIGAVTGYLANAWSDLTGGTDAFSAAAASFPVLNFIISNYLVFTVGVLFLVLIVFYAKPNQEGLIG